MDLVTVCVYTVGYYRMCCVHHLAVIVSLTTIVTSSALVINIISHVKLWYISTI